MFSENEIVNQCRQCGGHCEEIKKCPLKIEWTADADRKILPSISDKWNLSFTGKSLYMPEGGTYSTEDLISGLNKLGSHF